MKLFSVYDMDGTIVDSLHRYRTKKNEFGQTVIDLPYWRENEHKAEQDGLLPLASKYRAELSDPDCCVIIATARVLRDPDMRFIKNRLGMPSHIISRRGDNDNRKGVDLKLSGLLDVLPPPCDSFKVEFFEDNINYLDGVVDGLRRAGYNTAGHYIPSEQGH